MGTHGYTWVTWVTEFGSNTMSLVRKQSDTPFESMSNSSVVKFFLKENGNLDVIHTNQGPPKGPVIPNCLPIPKLFVSGLSVTR